MRTNHYSPNAIIKLAQRRGSTAKTASRARRYLAENPSVGLDWINNLDNNRAVINPISYRPADQYREDSRLRRIARKLRCNDYPYRISGTRFDGGYHTTNWYVTDNPADISVRTWSDNRKWSGNDTFAYITVCTRVLRYLSPSNIVIGGLITLDLEPVGVREYRAAWVEQSRGFSLKIVRGYIIRGYHVRTDNIDVARRRAKTAREKSLSATQKKRNQRR